SANAFTGTSTFSNATYSALFTGGNVGIGTTAPGSTLDVRGGINGGTNGTEFTVSGAGVVSAATSVLSPTFDTSTGVAMDIGGTTQTALTLGRVGAATTINGLDLTVGPTTWTATPTISGLITATSGLTANGALTATSAFTLGDSGDLGSIATSDWGITTGGSMTGISGIANDGAYTQTGVSANAFTGTSTFSNATYSALFTGGNVGIGTTAPTSTLSVGGSSQFQVNSTGNIVMLNNVVTSFPASQGAANSILQNNGAGTLTWFDPSGTGVAGFWQRNGANLAPSNIGDSIGIGTTTPGALLEVNGTSWLRGGTAPTSGLFVNSSGSVGIGTTGPTSLLHLNASAKSGVLLNLAYGTTTTLDGDLIGAMFNLDDGTVIATDQNVTGIEVKLPTVTNTHTVGTKTLKGFYVDFGTGSGLNQTGAGGTTSYNALQVDLPSLTQTAGTLNVNGLYVNSPSSITTGGTASSLYINSTGVNAGSLYGVNISNITAGAGTERALNIGSGWDSVLAVNGVTVINGTGVTQIAGGGTTFSTYTKGDMIYADENDTLAKLGIGAPDQILGVSAGGVPVWGTMDGTNCVNCLISSPTGDQIIVPSGQDTTGLVVRQTSSTAPTDDVFTVSNPNGTVKYFYIDSAGVVNIPDIGASSGDQLTIEPGIDKYAIKLLGTNVATNSLQLIESFNTSGTIFDLGYTAATALAGSLTGMDIDLSTNLTVTDQNVTGQKITMPTFTNTNVSGTKSYYGIQITPPGAGGVNQNGAGGTSEYILANLTMPALTQTAGTLNAYGVNLTMPSSISTGGTAYAVNINANGVGAGTLYGMNISSIAAGAGSERAINIGTGWDYGIYSATTGSSSFAGSVGVGTTTPTSALSVGASSQFQVNSTGNIVMLNNVVTSFPASQGVANSFLQNNGAGTLTWFDPSGTGVAGFWQRNGINLAPTNIGDSIGIGTTTPGALLEVNGTSWLRGGTAPTSGLYVNSLGSV
ncbi:MAG: hypothetical protein Q7T74_06140, partial [Candidatus Saccharibacteria bacterium]|nr:hypothetical protein [Candidatus Saccharibacteria bacterium]